MTTVDKAQTYTACLIIIGNEILSGRTMDKNLSYIGKRCDELGISMMECRVIPDDEQEIIATLKACADKFDYVFTTGGIGPTHDDITAASIAKCFNVDLQRNQEAVDAILTYYGPDKMTEARLKMADIPAGASLIDNPVSGAPGFQVDNVFVFAGVPVIMQAMFEGIIDRLTGGRPMLSTSIMTALPESLLAPGLGRIQEHYPDVSIGSYPFFREGKTGVNLVMRSPDRDRLLAVAEEIAKLVNELEP